jgi:cyanate permease
VKGLIPGIGQFRPMLNEFRTRATLTSAAAVLGLVGLFCLAAGLAAMLAQWLQWWAALLITAAAFLAIAGVIMWTAVRQRREKGPSAETEEMADDIAESATAMLTDLPVEVARRMIAERPLAALALFSGFGALLARKPEAAFRLLERLVANFDLDRK